ncbi:molybdate ABC transporter substrate-binding protein [Mangrovactinospora gilvigrisea]|uniref:Molybdate ABC transporter substrate-binding protein n=1 Tax=Mangrovactinospora gilvigrisea TaxID=1428644 RepID=A0A1J7BPH6_9ACTN|nr:molybdate ABC transporter substrate-binding protein [Mangrovactinospora gilvigrisea]OIV35353.1 molybdate ABC transporter substrate-binding protein [Mangrovactinospora gilvigrisea]
MRTTPRTKPILALAAASAAAVLIAGCGSSSGASSPSSSSSAKGGAKAGGTLTVLAAASLKESFTELAADFKKQTGTTVRPSFGGSQQLAVQVNQGSPADVIATADTLTMKKLAGKVGTSTDFASNKLVIAVRSGNPKHIATLADLAKSNVTVVLAGPTVPAGHYALEALKKAGVTVKPKSEETDVRAALSKVSLGEADASIVYATDVEAVKSGVQAVQIPAKDNVLATYPIATIDAGKNQASAKKFAAFVAGPTGQQVLQAHGFGKP